MTVTSQTASLPGTLTADLRTPTWPRVAAFSGAAWNAFGLFQFAKTTFASEQRLQARGMSAAQASLYAGLPAWVTLAFAVAVLAGTVGAAFLAARRGAARPLLALSVLGYALLFLGDIIHGVFAAFGPPQVVVIGASLLIAVGLYALARRARPLPR